MNKAASLVSLLILGISLGIGLVFLAPEPKASPTIEWLDNPRALKQFGLSTESGLFNNQSLHNHWTIVVLGFLNCPDVCPTSLSQLAELHRTLASNARVHNLGSVFVSVDPERDSNSAVSQYVKYFHPSIRGVTGNQDQLTQFADNLGLQFGRVPSEPPNYTITHSVTFSIIGPAGRLRGRIRPGFVVSDLARELTDKLLEADT